MADQKVFSVSTTPQNVSHAKMALTRAGHKLPTPIYIVVDKGAELIK
jgi:large subunit ribosomal protein L10e